MLSSAFGKLWRLTSAVVGEDVGAASVIDCEDAGDDVAPVPLGDDEVVVVPKSVVGADAVSVVEAASVAGAELATASAALTGSASAGESDVHKQENANAAAVNEFERDLYLDETVLLVGIIGAKKRRSTLQG